MKTVTVKCVQCGETREIQPNEITPGEMPEYQKCYGLMTAQSAKIER